MNDDQPPDDRDSGIFLFSKNRNIIRNGRLGTNQEETTLLGGDQTVPCDAQGFKHGYDCQTIVLTGVWFTSVPRTVENMKLIQNRNITSCLYYSSLYYSLYYSHILPSRYFTRPFIV